MGKLSADSSAVLNWIRLHISERLGVPVEMIEPDVPLADFGLDSIVAIHLCAQLGEAVGQAIDPGILIRATTLADMAEQVAAQVRGASSGSGTGGLAEALAHDARLSADLGSHGFARPEDDGAPRTILLTGGTGFVGAFLLAELLRRSTAHVLCHVRAKDAEAGLARLRESLGRHGLWREEDALRLTVLPGDLEAPRLGWGAETWARAAAEVDVIVHNGAFVHFLYDYATLRAANVLATLEVLRLAAAGRGKAVHFVSTVGAVPPGADGHTGTVTEEWSADPGDPTHLPNGYEQSKWVAERLVYAARERGLAAAIHRLGLVSGPSTTGVYDNGDFLSSLLRTALLSGTFPQVHGAIPMVPVDHVARWLSMLALDPAATAQPLYHLAHPEPLEAASVAALLAEAGHAVTVMPWTDWREALLAHGPLPPDHPLSAYAGFIRAIPALAMPRFHMARVRAALPEAVAECPPSAALLALYLSKNATAP